MSSEPSTRTPPAAGPSNDDLLKEFEIDLNRRNKRPRTIEGYLSHIRLFYRFLEERKASPLGVAANSQLLTDFLDDLRLGRLSKNKPGQTMSGAYVNYIFNGLSAFYDFLHYTGLVPGNPILPFRKRYLAGIRAEYQRHGSGRRPPTNEKLVMFISACTEPMSKAMFTLLPKTGIRRQEMININIDDVDWEGRSIRIYDVDGRGKREYNRIVFFDEETERVLQAWIHIRQSRALRGEPALFVSETGNRIDKEAVRRRFSKYAKRVGLHDPESKDPRKQFTPHYCRYWFTQTLRRAGMAPEFRRVLRGDAKREAMDFYDPIDEDELRKEYLRCMPRLGI